MNDKYVRKWKPIIDEYNNFGRTNREFCKLKSINESCLYKALKVFKNEEDKKVNIIKLKPESLIDNNINIKINGVSLSFDSSISNEALLKIMKSIIW